MKPKPKSVTVYRTRDLVIVVSISKVTGGLRQQDGWSENVAIRDIDSVGLGRVVLSGVERSGVTDGGELPVVPRGSTVAAVAGGFSSEDEMLASGVESAAVDLRGCEWEVVPMVNMGPGKGWSGHDDAPEITYEGEWSAEGLGAAVLEALDAAARLSRV